MSAIFYHDAEQKQLAVTTRDKHQKHLARPIATVITKALPFYNAENYHQKYQLRHYPKVLDALNLTDEELITSPVACRLNGYLGGFGTTDAFLEEKDSFGLPDHLASYILKEIGKRHR
ncbi:peptide methionine sulfoxide reductase-like [Mya arenaria]|uniref:peptide methionine sulfoxide reductase-like n=1 Tax=Mya arenaria TaxID=6604 RepID=UPI0022E000B7|nr:peptide methionine sulfoxide reductase-like [Mya arenaria]